MENTSVLTVGITSDRALGSTFNTLRAQFERMRMPFEGKPVEPYINEISRLALEMDTTAQAQKRLVSDQAWASEAQIQRVRRLTDELERQCKCYLSLANLRAQSMAAVSDTVAPPWRHWPPDVDERDTDRSEGRRHRHGCHRR